MTEKLTTRITLADLREFFKIQELVEEMVDLQKKLSFPTEIITKTENILVILKNLEFDVFLKTDGGGKGN